MVENLNTLEINETLKQLLSEVKGQKQEMNSLKEEVRGTSVSVSSEVKNSKRKKSLNGVLKDIKLNSYLTRNWKMGLNKLFGLLKHYRRCRGRITITEQGLPIHQEEEKTNHDRLYTCNTQMQQTKEKQSNQSPFPQRGDHNASQDL